MDSLGSPENAIKQKVSLFPMHEGDGKHSKSLFGNH